MLVFNDNNCFHILFDIYNIKPVMGVIPNNQDETLLKNRSANCQKWFSLAKKLTQVSKLAHILDFLILKLNSGFI